MGAHADAQEALLKEITRQASGLEGKTTNTHTAASAVRDLALAFRYIAGGPQPGSVTVEK